MLPELARVTDQIAALPGIGRKSAMRVAFYLLRQPPEQVQLLVDSILQFTHDIEYCNVCGCIKSKAESCNFCKAADSTTVCVVEQPSDVFSIDNAGEYKGLYHVLMGVLSPLDGIHPEDLRLEQLRSRLNTGDVREVIVATNPSIEGNATAHYIAQMVEEIKKSAKEPLTIEVTRIASGLAMGSQLDYADSQVISQSIKARVPIEL